MANINNNENEVKLPSPNKPKLTMKFLHILILEIRQENDELVQRIIELEQQLGEIYQTRGEVATANEQLLLQEDDRAQENQKEEIHNHKIQTSRSERHAPPRKKSFWFL